MYRLILTNEEDFTPTTIDLCDHDFGFMPNGVKFCYSSNFDTNRYIQKHLYYFEPYETHLLSINSYSDLWKFTKKFGVDKNGGNIFSKDALTKPIMINWQKVSQHYGGIDISHEVGEHLKNKFYWLEDWEPFPGGYIWNKDVFKKITRLTTDEVTI